MDKLGDLIGVDLPGSLTELLEQLFGIKGGFAGVKEWFESLPASVGKWFSDTNEKVKEAGQRVVDALSGFGSWLWAQITKFVGDSLGTLSNFGGWLWDRITTSVSSAWTTLSGFGSWIWEKVKSAINNTWADITGFGTWLFNSLKSALGSVGSLGYKAFHNAIASLLNSISNIELPLVGKPFKGLFGTIPMLNTGAMITGDGLAFLHAGERVLNPAETKRTSQLGMGQGMNVTIQMNAPVYGVDDLERTIRDLLSREQLGYSGYR